MRRALWVVLLASTTAAAQVAPVPDGTAAEGTPEPPAAGAPAAVAPPPATPAAPVPQPAARAAVFAVHVEAGVDASLSSLVAQQLRRSAARRGYVLVDEAVARGAAARAGAAGALSPERASALVMDAGAAAGVFASVGLRAGRYRVGIQVVRADGSPATSAEARGSSSDLYVDVDRALFSILPPPTMLRAAAPLGPPPDLMSGPRAAPLEPFPEARWRLAAGTAVAFGVSGGEFRNHLLGARIDRRFSDDVALGLAVQYANLKGKEGRAHNVLPWALFEYRIDLGGGFAVPLRYATGYLANNGPVLHAAAGLALPLGDDVELSLELFAPSVWIVQERAVLSLDFAAEVAFTP